MDSCPRCGKSDLRTEDEGHENGKLLWSLFYCQACNYTFRDTETENVLTPEMRKAIFQVDADNKDQYKPMMPGMV